MLVVMSWRNLWRNKRRTMLTVSAIGLGLVFLITMVSFMEGFMEMMVEQIARSSMGHLQIHQKDYLEKRSTKLVIEDASRVADVVEQTPGVKALSSRLVFSGSIQSNMSSSIQVVRVMAVDPERERDFSALVDKVTQGGFVVPPPESLAADAPMRARSKRGILIGKKLADQLKVGLGSKVRLETAGFGGGSAASGFWVTGILETGTEAFDKQLVMVSLQDMQKVSGAGDVVHEISVMVEDASAIEAVSDRVRNRFEAQLGAEAAGTIRVAPWWEISPDIKQMMDASGAWNAMLYLLMLVILSAGILTTMFMVVMERRREFGVQLAVGTRPAMLFAGVMMEALYIALLSALVGLALGGVAVYFLAAHGLDLSWLMEGIEWSGLFIPNVYIGSSQPMVFVEPTVVVFVGTILFALWPALKVARMKALDAIRQGGTTG